MLHHIDQENTEKFKDIKNGRGKTAVTGLIEQDSGYLTLIM